MMYLKATSAKNSKLKLEQACEGSGWLTFLTRSQDGTDLSREEFRDNLLCRLYLILQDTPLKCDGCSNPLTVEHFCHCKRGGLAGIRSNLLNK